MKRIGDKRAAAHLEIIISFVLFVGFTLFLLSTLQPTKKNVLQDSVLLSLKNEFFKNVTTNFTTVLVKRTGSICQPWEVPGNAISSTSGLGPNYYYVYVSPDFASTMTNCSNNNYVLGFIDTQIVVSNKSLSSVKILYDQTYDSFKSYFGVPAAFDFGISTDNIIMEKNIPQFTEVLSAKYRQPVLYSNGTVINQDFLFKVW